MKAIELLKEDIRRLENRIRKMYAGSLSPESRLSGYKVVVGELQKRIKQLQAELEKPEPTSDAVKILCKRYGTSLAKIAIDLEVENERLKERYSQLVEQTRRQIYAIHKRLKGFSNCVDSMKDQALAKGVKNETV